MLGVAASSMTACRTGQGRGASVDDGVRAAITARDRSLEQAELRGDAAAVADHYTLDATLRGTGGAPDVHGRAAIEATMRRVYQATRTERVMLRAEGLAGGRDTVLETGRFTYQFRTSGDSLECDRGRYEVTWQRGSDRVWRIKEDRSQFEPSQPGACAPDA